MVNSFESDDDKRTVRGSADRARETRTPFERLVIMEQTNKMIRGSQN